MNIKERLYSMADEAYKNFHKKLIPNVNEDTIIGIRLPELRRLAKEIAKNDPRDFINTAVFDTYEEKMLCGMVIGAMKASIEERFEYIRSFVPLIDNWAVCDTFCNSLKEADKRQAEYFEFIEDYIRDERPYYIRFAAVMYLSHFINEEYIEKVIKRLDNVRHEDYYVKMGVAWALSMCFVKFPERMMEYLKNECTLDDFTYNKTIQKIRESLRVDKDTKDVLKAMKRTPQR